MTNLFVSSPNWNEKLKRRNNSSVAGWKKKNSWKQSPWRVVRRANNRTIRWSLFPDTIFAALSIHSHPLASLGVVRELYERVQARRRSTFIEQNWSLSKRPISVSWFVVSRYHPTVIFCNIFCNNLHERSFCID